LCENETLRKNMGLAGQERMKHYFKIGNIIDEYQKVYEKAIATWQASVLN
jgi:hypothetical protein